jgi:hypothetical protein
MERDCRVPQQVLAKWCLVTTLQLVVLVPLSAPHHPVGLRGPTGLRGRGASLGLTPGAFFELKYKLIRH